MASSIRQFVKRWLELSIPRRLFLVRGSSSLPVAALTFDDGPDPELTGRVLEILRREGVKATFFVVGQKVAQYPETMAQIAADGHEIGHHSFTHSDPSRTSAGRFAKEIAETRRALDGCCSARPRFVRPPHGKLTPGKILAAWWNGLGVALWSADPKDFAASADRIKEYFRRSPLQGGDVVLLHDTSAETVDALPEIIRGGHARGLTFARLEELVR